MFENRDKIEPLSLQRHGQIRLKKVNNFEFARRLASVPVGLQEIAIACRYYPIVLPAEGPTVPMALLSLQAGKNSYINTHGHWTAPYVPAAIRRYPFILAETRKPEKERSEEEEQMVVCIDLEAPHFQLDEGEKGLPLFTATKRPSALTLQAIELLKEFQTDLLAAEEGFRQLSEKGCLQVKELKTGNSGIRKDESDRILGRFRIADLTAISRLDDTTLGSWVRGGILFMAQAQNLSLANLQRFTPARVEVRLGQPAVPSTGKSFGSQKKR